MQHRQSQKTEYADNRRIYDLSDDKSSKDRIALDRQMQDHISLHRFEHCINDLFRLHGEFLFTEQYINWDNDTDQHVQKLVDHIDHALGQIWHKNIDLIQQICPHPIFQKRRRLFQCLCNDLS